MHLLQAAKQTAETEILLEIYETKSKLTSLMHPCSEATERRTTDSPKKAGRKRLPVDHITLNMLQEQGLFDVPIQVELALVAIGLQDLLA